MTIKLMNIIKAPLTFVAFISALVLALMIVAQVALWIGIAWLNTGNGQTWLQDKIAAQLEGSGYTIAFKRLGMPLRRSLMVSGLQVADADGPILTADDLLLSVDILPLLGKDLVISLRGGHVALLRLPQASGRAPQDDTPVTLPENLPFRSIKVQGMNLRALDIGAAVAGVPFHLSPNIGAMVTYDDQLHITLQGRLYRNEDNPAWLPDIIDLHARLQPDTMMMTADRIAAHAPSYTLGGFGTMTADGTLDLNLTARSDNLEPLIPGEPGTAQVTARLYGASDALRLEATGQTNLAILQKRDLDDVRFKGHIENLSAAPQGHIDIDTHYHDLPLSADTDFAYNAPLLALENLAVTGPDLIATGALQMNTDSTLVTGTLEAIADKLETYATLAGKNMGGKAKAAITLSATDGKQGISLNGDFHSIRYDDMAAQSAHIEALLPDLAVPLPTALTVRAKDIMLPGAIHLTRLNADTAQVENDYTITIDSAGEATTPFTLKGDARIGGITEHTYMARDIALTLGIADGTLKLSGQIDAAGAALKIKADGVDLSRVADNLPAALDHLRLSGDVGIDGPINAPVIAVTLKTSAITPVENGPSVTVTTMARYESGMLHATIKGDGHGIEQLEGTVNAPMTLSLLPFAFTLPPDRALDGILDARLDGKALAQMLLPDGHKAAGTITMHTEISGNIRKPAFNGTLAVADGAYSQTASGVTLDDITLQASISPAAINVEKLTATDGAQGRLSGTGRIDLDGDGGARLSLTLADMHLMQHGNADGFVSGNLDFGGRGDGYALAGTLKPGPLNITIPERFQGNIPQLNIVEADADNKKGSELLETLALDVTVDAPQRIFVRGWGLDAECGGTVHIGGTLAKPVMDGNFAAIRGAYEEFGKRFTLAHANLRFQGTVPPSPYLDIKADTVTDDGTASVLLTGPVLKPKIRLSAAPPLPEDEILSRILFGSDMSHLSPYQAFQLTQTLQRFSGNGGGGFDPLGQIRSITGLDDLHVETDSSGAASVGVGKYLTDKVYLEFGKGAETGSARLEVELTPQISIESKIGQDAQGGGSIFWKKDY